MSIYNFKMCVVNWIWLHAPALYNNYKTHSGFGVSPFFRAYISNIYMTCILHANNICMHHGYSCWQAKVAKLEENPDAYDEESEEESQESDNSSDDPEINTAEIVGKEIPTSSKPVGKDIPTDSSSSDKGVGKEYLPGQLSTRQWGESIFPTVLSQARRSPMAPLLHPVPAQAGLIKMLHSWDS